MPASRAGSVIWGQCDTLQSRIGPNRSARALRRRGAPASRIRQEEERLANERADAAEREAKARAETEAQTRARQQAEADRAATERLRLEQMAAADRVISI